MTSSMDAACFARHDIETDSACFTEPSRQEPLRQEPRLDYEKYKSIKKDLDKIWEKIEEKEIEKDIEKKYKYKEITPEKQTEYNHFTHVYVYTLQPLYPEYTGYQARLKTFKNSWPRYLRGPKIEDLARSGLFYSQIGDKTVCFHCGIGLKAWEPNDCAYKEHACFSPHCKYIKMVGK